MRWASEAGVDSIEHGHLMDDDAIATMKKNGTYLVPTLYLDGLDPRENAAKPQCSGHSRQEDAIGAERRDKNIRESVCRGREVAFGTDAAVYPHGLNAHEFAVYVRLGLTPLQAIQTATINDADLLGWSDKVGSDRAGKVGRHDRGGWRSLKDVTTLSM